VSTPSLLDVVVAFRSDRDILCFWLTGAIVGLSILAGGARGLRLLLKLGVWIMGKPNYHVTPRPDGRWQVIQDNADRASSVHERKSDAVDRGRELARDRAVDLRIHGRDGKIQDSDSYGNDPNPPRDERH
jgi:hypothetical protein